MRSYTAKEYHIGSAVTKILRYTDRQTHILLGLKVYIAGQQGPNFFRLRLKEKIVLVVTDSLFDDGFSPYIISYSFWNIHPLPVSWFNCNFLIQLCFDYTYFNPILYIKIKVLEFLFFSSRAIIFYTRTIMSIICESKVW